jgi:hypothetical protein
MASGIFGMGPRQQPIAGPRPIQAPFGTPEYYQERAQILAGMTGDPVSAFNGSTAPNTTPAFSQTDPAGWRGRVMATTGQDPVAPGTAWAAPRAPQANPQFAQQQGAFNQAMQGMGAPGGRMGGGNLPAMQPAGMQGQQNRFQQAMQKMGPMQGGQLGGGNPQLARQQQFAQALMQQQAPNSQPQAYASQQRDAWQQQNPSGGGAFTGWQPQQANYAAKMQSLGGPAGGSIFSPQRSGFSTPPRAVSQGAWTNRRRGLF